ncbi:hypothetical protein C2S52_006239 [Perilla frutescens var. hirtella]|nr:hypothetical protein C2S51_009540 [Perilla frutescens var. frutescens]KAH6786687.1 hypothetical protein C2S52_006239 [Perilla frutescens var. hirtella]
MEHPTAYLEPVFYKMMEIDGPTQSLCLPRQFYMGNTDSIPPVLLPSLFVDECKFIKGIDSIKLQNWSGRAWKVSIMHEYGGHYMTNGWTEFKEQNNIKWQDMLTFHHIGKDIMRVSIFGPDGCLKQHATPFNEPHLGRRQPRCQN